MRDARQGVNSGISFVPTANYIIAEEPTLAQSSDTILYYGFVAWDGGWYIMKRDLTAGTNRFAVGTSGFTTAWANKLSQTYDRFDLVF